MASGSKDCIGCQARRSPIFEATDEKLRKCEEDGNIANNSHFSVNLPSSALARKSLNCNRPLNTTRLLPVTSKEAAGPVTIKFACESTTAHNGKSGNERQSPVLGQGSRAQHSSFKSVDNTRPRPEHRNLDGINSEKSSLEDNFESCNFKYETKAALYNDECPLSTAKPPSTGKLQGFSDVNAKLLDKRLSALHTTPKCTQKTVEGNSLDVFQSSEVAARNVAVKKELSNNEGVVSSGARLLELFVDEPRNSAYSNKANIPTLGSSVSNLGAGSRAKNSFSAGSSSYVLSPYLCSSFSALGLRHHRYIPPNLDAKIWHHKNSRKLDKSKNLLPRSYSSGLNNSVKIPEMDNSYPVLSSTSSHAVSNSDADTSGHSTSEKTMQSCVSGGIRSDTDPPTDPMVDQIDPQLHCTNENLPGFLKSPKIDKMDWKAIPPREYVKWAANRLFRLDMHHILAFPIFVLISLLLAFEFLIYCFIRMAVPLCESAYFRLFPAEGRIYRTCVGGSNLMKDPSFVANIPVSEEPPERRRKRNGFFYFFKFFFRNNKDSWDITSHYTTTQNIPAKKIHEINRKRKDADNYNVFAVFAKALDVVTLRSFWKEDPASRSYDYEAVKKRLQQLRERRENNDVIGLIAALRYCIHFEFAGIWKEHMYSRTYIGTKRLVEDFVEEAVMSLEYLEKIAPSCDAATRTDLKILVQHVCGQWGATGLILSGGAALGLYHFGVCEVLLQTSVSENSTEALPKNNLLPRVICGTSAGAAVAAWICTRTDIEIAKYNRSDYLVEIFNGFSPNNWLLRIWNIFRQGYMCDVEVWQESVFKLFEYTTFLEAYKRTGRILNISMTRADRHEPALVLNYKNAPDVLISTAVLASVSFPFLGLPFRLKEKRRSDGCIVNCSEFESAYFHDGSLKGDVPVKALKDSWGTKFTIVSQVNPHIFPFSGLRAHGEAGMPINWRGTSGNWRAGFLLSGLELFFKENMRFLLRLIALLDLSPTWRGINCGTLALQSYSGDITVHPKGLTWRHLKLANDPSQSDVDWYLSEGKKMIFPKISLIRNRMKIDRALESLYQALLRTSSNNFRSSAFVEANESEASKFTELPDILGNDDRNENNQDGNVSPVDYVEKTGDKKRTPSFEMIEDYMLNCSMVYSSPATMSFLPKGSSVLTTESSE